MRVRLFPADAGGVGTYRLAWPGQVLADLGYEVSVEAVGTTLQTVCRDLPDGTVETVAAVDPGCDVVVLQRTLRTDLLDVIAALQEIGVAVVLEVDDHFGALHPTNPAHAALVHDDPDGPKATALREACALADLVTCTTPALAAYYAPHGRVRVIPNYVRRSWLSIDHARHSGPVRVGWTGTLATHARDHGSTLAPVRRLVESDDVEFVSIGGQALLDHYLIDGTSIPWADLQTEEYPRAVGSLDVGIVPLKLTRFNEAKSWIKGLEYAACGVAFVASPTPAYRELDERYGIGLLARLPGEWTRHLERLVRSTTYREGIAAKNRARVERLILEDHVGEWWDAWSLALEHRRSA